MFTCAKILKSRYKLERSVPAQVVAITPDRNKLNNCMKYKLDINSHRRTGLMLSRGAVESLPNFFMEDCNET